jgi:hypothetical protein
MQQARWILCLFLIGCQTNFVGSPHIDPATCASKCAQDRLAMAGMVYMGEYSSACICEVPRPPSAPTTATAAGAMGTTVGVIMQMRRQAEEQQQGMRQGPQAPNRPGRR